MYHHLFFDADGTLFDFDQAEKQAFYLMANELKLNLGEEDFNLYKACNAACWREFEQGRLTLAALKPERFFRFAAEGNLETDPATAALYYEKHLGNQAILIEQSQSVLNELVHRGYRLHLATNGIASVQRSRLAQSGIGPLFDTLFISEELGCQKPDSRFFTTMLEVLGANEQKSCCLMIGDSLRSDIAGARQVGLDTVWYNPMRIEATDERTYEIGELTELLGILTGSG